MRLLYSVACLEFCTFKAFISCESWKEGQGEGAVGICEAGLIWSWLDSCSEPIDLLAMLRNGLEDDIIIHYISGWVLDFQELITITSAPFIQIKKTGSWRLESLLSISNTAVDGLTLELVESQLTYRHLRGKQWNRGSVLLFFKLVSYTHVSMDIFFNLIIYRKVCPAPPPRCLSSTLWCLVLSWE